MNLDNIADYIDDEMCTKFFFSYTRKVTSTLKP